MNVKEINIVKQHLDQLKSAGLVSQWELPYENLLTRLSAAIFFITPADDPDGSWISVCRELEQYPNFSFRENTERKLSNLHYRITFSKEEKEKNTEIVDARL